MHHRHKVPTIFNIYMLDVICCALGCVVLLWQVAHQEAEEQTAVAVASQTDAAKQSAEAMEARRKFEQAQSALLSASSDVAQLQSTVADWRGKHETLTQALLLTQKEREEARKLAAQKQQALEKSLASLTLSSEQLKTLETNLAALQAQEKKSQTDLAGAKKVNTDLLARIAALKSEIGLKQSAADLAAKEAKDRAVALKLSEENAAKLQKLLDSLKAESKTAQAKTQVTELQLKMREQELEKTRQEILALLAARDKLGKDLSAGSTELADARRLLAALTAERDQWKDKHAASAKEKASLNRRVLDLQAEVEQRFAGIPLSGESVVFLIDVSGSMMMRDESTEDPDKWPLLCETLMKLMRSIPTLQRFQIILFSDKTSYLFGNRDTWLKYEGAETAKLARDALRKIKVEGGTNMHDAFDEAFRYRKIKLDTIYLFSDGLPNLGAGLSAGSTLSESQRSQQLGKYVRDKLRNDWNRPQKGLNDVRINAVGYFFESPDVGAFLWALAREHRGSFVGLR